MTAKLLSGDLAASAASSDQPDPSAALLALGALDQQTAPLQLITAYQGVLLRQDVMLLAIDPHAATVQATNLKMCAVLQGSLYLNSPLFPRPMIARLFDLDLNAGVLVLSDLAYLTAWHERQSVRVCQKSPVYVSLRCRKRAGRFPLIDISIGGMGILAYKIEATGLQIETGSPLRLDFDLEYSRCTAVRGRVAYLKSLSPSLTRLGVCLYPTNHQAHSLEKHIAHREKEILAEIDRVYWQVKDSPGIESQYF